MKLSDYTLQSWTANYWYQNQWVKITVSAFISKSKGLHMSEELRKLNNEKALNEIRKSHETQPK